MANAETILVGWNEFFFAAKPVTGIAMFRIVFGCLLLVHGLLWFRDWKTFLTPGGIRPPRSGFRTSPQFNLFHCLPEKNCVVATVIAVHCLANFMMAVGLFTTASTLVAFVTMTSIHDRNRMVLHSGDGVLRLVTFLMIFTPAGKALSVDAFLAGTSHETVLASPWSIRLIQIQIAIVYLRSVYWKLRGQAWRDGSAVFYATHAKSYRRFPLPRILRQRPAYTLATWMTLLVETALGTLVWLDDFRPAMVGVGVLLHLSIEFALNVHLFGWTMMVCLFVFLC